MVIVVYIMYGSGIKLISASSILKYICFNQKHLVNNDYDLHSLSNEMMESK